MQVFHAPGVGDETIVGLPVQHPGAVVVTADRALVDRVRAVGGDVRGPRWLLELLER